MRHKTTDSQFKMRQSTAGRVKVRSCDGTRVLRNQWRPFGRQVVLSCQSAADGRPPLNGKAFDGQVQCCGARTLGRTATSGNAASTFASKVASGRFSRLASSTNRVSYTGTPDRTARSRAPCHKVLLGTD